MTSVRLELAAPRSRVKHSATEPLRSLENFVDPDQMASSSDQDLQCFQKRINPGSAGQGLSQFIHECCQKRIVHSYV